MNITKVDTYKRPHRRFNCFPGRRTTYATCRVVVLIDVSGSVGDESLQYCVNTIAAMAKAYSCVLKIFTYDYGI
ncbi:MAG: hypothetical protein N2250_09545, partial [Pseudothermotoga sp.]|nr:hypothetical protein [Pseudothermotoga sp.]